MKAVGAQWSRGEQRVVGGTPTTDSLFILFCHSWLCVPPTIANYYREAFY